MSSDDVIDLHRYRRERNGEPGGSGLSLRGADGERRHFALPLWRMAAVAGAAWSALVRAEGGEAPVPVTIVDLGSAEPRDEPPGGLPGDPRRDPPSIVEGSDGTLTVPVCAQGGRVWFVVLGQREPARLASRQREDLLFLAGECAGLLALFDGERAFSPTSPSDA